MIFLFLFFLSCEASNKAKTGPFTIIFNSPPDLPAIQVKNGADTIWHTSLNRDANILTALTATQNIRQNGGNYIIENHVLDKCTDIHFDDMSVLNTKTTPQILISGRSSCNNDVITLMFQSILSGTHDHLYFNLTLHTQYYNQLRLTYGCADNEQFYGLGVQYTHFNMRGHSVPLFISEQGVGRGLEPLTIILDSLSPGAGGNRYTTYSRVPFYLSSYNRSLLLESLDYTIFHFPLLGTTVTIETNSSTLYGRIIPGKSPLDLLESYTYFAGRMTPLPDWSHSGAILGLQGGTKRVIDILNQVNETIGNLDDVVGVWLQDWSGQKNITGPNDLPRIGLWWNWEVDRNHYPGWEGLIQTLYSQGIRVTTYINPLFNDVTKRGTPYQHNYYEEGLKNGYFIKTANGEVWSGYSQSSLVDLTNPQAYDWIKNIIIKNMLATNVSGWMCDFGESVPLDAVLYGGQDPTQYHTMYSAIWSELNAQAISEAVTRSLITREQALDVIYFMRSGSTHSPRVTPLFWLGDQLVTWDSDDGLGSAIIGMLSSGLSGFSLTHSDIGGYTSIKYTAHFLNYIRERELFLRWCEFAAFTLIYRTHEGTLPYDNWQFYTNKETMKHFFHMAKVYRAWKFYRNTLIAETVKYGWPVLRHMMLVFPGNSKIHFEDLRYQFMLGTELLVAPVYKKGAESVKVFLPAGITWIHTWTNISYTGNNNWAKLPAPLGYPAVLYPSGSAVGNQFTRNLLNLLGISNLIALETYFHNKL